MRRGRERQIRHVRSPSDNVGRARNDRKRELRTRAAPIGRSDRAPEQLPSRHSVAGIVRSRFDTIGKAGWGCAARQELEHSAAEFAILTLYTINRRSPEIANITVPDPFPLISWMNMPPGIYRARPAPRVTAQPNEQRTPAPCQGSIRCSEIRDDTSVQ